jgi:hypothetical protein
MCEETGHVSWWAKTYHHYGRILAAQARIEGMKVENYTRHLRNEAPAYTEEAFQQQAEIIETEAIELSGI